ncbi:MAG: glycosyltransferase family 4 protein, partial [Bacteroidota bacterium]|nr:glycosyltransferase family 4 protein [Bacteroidota bacterium]
PVLTIPAPTGPRHPDAQLLPPPPPRPLAAPEPMPAFDETVEEMGAAEASDLDASEDDLTLDEDVPATDSPGAVLQVAMPAGTGVSLVASSVAKAAPVTTAARAAGPGLLPRQPRFDGLNFRMIQYARRAMQLVAGHGDFGVIYAPGWPAWLAALEIRNRTGRPLVLYAAALASDTAAPAERGWLLHIERMALRRARLVLVPDAGMQQQLCTLLGADLGEVRIVPAADETALQLVLAEVALD